MSTFDKCSEYQII